MKKIVALIFFLFPVLSEAQYILYGSAIAGGGHNEGTIFSYNPITNSQTIRFSFNGINGNGPEGNFLVVSDSLLYATTAWGGTYNLGTMFCFNVKTNAEKVLINFDGTNGYVSDGASSLIKAKDGLLYGTTFAGGTHNAGVIFSYDIANNKDSIRFNFDTNISGAGPYEALLEDTTTGFLYGVNKYGGANKLGGVLYRFNPVNNDDTVLVNFGNTNGTEPVSQLMKASNGLLYGITEGGGDSNQGIIYSYDIASNILTNQFNFYNKKGGGSNGNYLIQIRNGLIYGMAENGGIGGGGVLYCFNPTTDSEVVLVNFDNTNGGIPQGGLIQDPDDGLIYGMTVYGGGNSTGVFFSYDTITSSYTKIFDFTGSNGAYPFSGLTLVKDTSITTRVDKINGETNVRVYPNPSKDKFNFTLRNMNEPAEIQIFNVMGEGIYKATLNSDNTEINLNGQPEGIYFFRVTKEDGELVRSGKIVIEK